MSIKGGLRPTLTKFYNLCINLWRNSCWFRIYIYNCLLQSWNHEYGSLKHEHPRALFSHLLGATISKLPEESKLAKIMYIMLKQIFWIWKKIYWYKMKYFLYWAIKIKIKNSLYKKFRYMFGFLRIFLSQIGQNV